jgi:hypothetical protein
MLYLVDYHQPPQRPEGLLRILQPRTTGRGFEVKTVLFKDGILRRTNLQRERCLATLAWPDKRYDRK